MGGEHRSGASYVSHRSEFTDQALRFRGGAAVQNVPRSSRLCRYAVVSFPSAATTAQAGIFPPASLQHGVWLGVLGAAALCSSNSIFSRIRGQCAACLSQAVRRKTARTEAKLHFL